VDSAWEQKKPEASEVLALAQGKILLNRARREAAVPSVQQLAPRREAVTGCAPCLHVFLFYSLLAFCGFHFLNDKAFKNTIIIILQLHAFLPQRYFSISILLANWSHKRIRASKWSLI
jgi:hypothetical protein